MYATPSGDNTAACQNCDTTTTPLWRKSDDGVTTLCNACGLFLKLHGKNRPIALKSNVIRSRNRVRTPQNGSKRKTPYDAPATPGEIARQQQLQQAQQVQQAPSPSPYEPHPRSLMTPTQHDDSTHAEYTEDVFDPQLNDPNNAITNTMNPFNDKAQLPGTSGQDLQSRVNELEIINDIYRTRIEDLEAKQAEAEAQQADGEALKRRIEELEIALEKARAAAESQTTS